MQIDVAIIGGGISGLSAAIYTGHAGLKTVVFDSGDSQIKKVSSLHNYLGTPNISGEKLIQIFREQLQEYAEVKAAEVTSLKQEGEGFVLQAEEETYKATRVILATNIKTDLIEALGFEIAVNENIKSGKIKKVVGVNWEGTTSIPNLYIAGLLSGIPSQAVIAAGQGAAVGVRVAQDATSSKYMWHDIS